MWLEAIKPAWKGGAIRIGNTAFLGDKPERLETLLSNVGGQNEKKDGGGWGFCAFPLGWDFRGGTSFGEPVIYPDVLFTLLSGSVPCSGG